MELMLIDLDPAAETSEEIASQFAETITQKAIKIFDATGKMLPTAFVMGHIGGKTGAMILNNDICQMSPDAIRSVANSVQAFGVLFISEIYGGFAPTEKAASMLAEFKQNKELSGQFVMVTYEHKLLGVKIFVSEIKLEGTKRVLDEFKPLNVKELYTEPDNMFINFLPPIPKHMLN